MSYSSGFQAPGSWNWPDDLPKSESSREESSTTSSSPPQHPSGTSSARESTPPRAEPRSGRTHWPPRQCRICLETVQPTFNAASDSLPGFLQSPGVVYQDENGRLIRPCMCKGSSKYVHDACLQAWRHADPSYGRRNYWQCPTCGFKYRLARLGAGRFVGSIAAQISLTILILFLLIFFLGFVADPIIGLYVDPWSYMPWNSWSRPSYGYYYEDDEPYTWYEHFAKGFASMGVLGFLKVLLASPFSYFRIGGGGGRGRTGRDRVEQVSWIIILIGVGTFLAAVYKGVRAWSRRTLERAGERVMDVQNDDDDDE
ncbi:hypothetical protein FB567DRAFT_292045 [Paraphoma chrysanthemicola]|uniref:RING-CH-type domain-containing protein n=1 Tax=Paraphoma chrysanthemicola TaxID=798071 RepID=A0A8K0RAI3_9PLEO|nr:hypothetical protein FB567DRAFT_292045 [Paraphoma chrysanthemicola]